MERLRRISTQSTRTIIGLNSGTSMDGIDAVLVTVEGGGRDLRTNVLAFTTMPWPVSLRERLERAPHLTLIEATRLHYEIAEQFAEAARSVAALGGTGMDEIDLIGSHGQTVCHLSGRAQHQPASTLQLGDLDVIAERTGVITVGDFRARDVAAGGEGAPLVPYLDWILFWKRPRTVCLNIGGVANVTLVTEDLESCLAFDTGPGNLPLDALTVRLTKGREKYDPGGRLASQGSVDLVLLERLLRHPFLEQPPPRTTGREVFGPAWVDELLARHGHLKLLDILATCAAFVAKSVAEAVARWMPDPGGPREVVVSGGGVHNLTLMHHLRRAFFPVPVTTSQTYGVDPDAKEALLFAVLANERVCGFASNVPRATGARWPSRLGKIAL